jgi:hypothetical protein
MNLHPQSRCESLTLPCVQSRPKVWCVEGGFSGRPCEPQLCRAVAAYLNGHLGLLHAKIIRRSFTRAEISGRTITRAIHAVRCQGQKYATGL